MAVFIRVAKEKRHRRHSSRERNFKTIGFDGVLSSLSFAAERKGAAGGITAGAVRPRNDTLQGVRCAAAHMCAALQNNFYRAGPGRLAGVRLGSGSGRLPKELRRAACPHAAVDAVQHPASGWGQPAYARFESRCHRADVGIGPYEPFIDRIL